MEKLTRRNVLRYSKKNLLPADVEQFSGKDTSYFLTENRRLLEDCRQMYDALSDFRERRKRNLNYTMGRQWEDVIRDPDSPYGKRITEREYILRQGKIPLKNNIITKLKNSMVGLYRSQKTEPIAIARDRDDNRLGEMMSIALQYAYQVNEIHELNAVNFEEAMISGMAIRKVCFAWDDERRMPDVYTENINPSCIFLNNNIADVRMKDMTTFGVLRDMELSDVLRAFAKDAKDAQRITECYRNVNKYLTQSYNAFDGRRYTEMDFYVPIETDKCRVIEVWRKEKKERIRWHDVMKSQTGVCDIEDLDIIIEENSRRIQEVVQLGGNEDDVAVIEYEWFIDSFWYVRFLTPQGESLFEEETPYEHHSLPYIVRAYPMINGEVQSFVETIIDQQRYINRYITMMDFARGSGAKGMLMIPRQLIPDGMTAEDVQQAWVRHDGVLITDMKPGYEGLEPKQFSTSGVQMSDIQMLELQMRLVDDISGIHGALQGKTPSSGTPAALYAQEAQNASTNVLDFFEWYHGFVKECDYKLMKTIQQYYNEPRFINIAGSQFNKEAQWYNPQRIQESDFDISVSLTTATPAYRMYANDLLMKALEGGFIDFKMFLENSSVPFADKLLEQLKSKEKEQEEQQRAMMQQMGGGGGMPPMDGGGGMPMGGGAMPPMGGADAGQQPLPMPPQDAGMPQGGGEMMPPEVGRPQAGQMPQMDFNQM